MADPVNEETSKAVTCAESTCHAGDSPRSSWPQAQLQHALLQNADLSGADLSGADLSDADLSSAELESADLTEAVLTDAICQGVNLRDAKLVSATCLRTDLRDAKCQGADLTNCNLRRANLSRARMQSADAARAHFNYANLAGANLREAILCRARMFEATLANCVLTNADLSHAALMKLKPARASEIYRRGKKILQNKTKGARHYLRERDYLNAARGIVLGPLRILALLWLAVFPYFVPQLRLDGNPIHGTRISPDTFDPWLVLRRTYTNSRFQLIWWFFLVATLGPLAVRVGFWLAVGSAQQQAVPNAVQTLHQATTAIASIELPQLPNQRWTSLRTRIDALVAKVEALPITTDSSALGNG